VQCLATVPGRGSEFLVEICVARVGKHAMATPSRTAFSSAPVTVASAVAGASVASGSAQASPSPEFSSLPSLSTAAQPRVVLLGSRANASDTYVHMLKSELGLREVAVSNHELVSALDLGKVAREAFSSPPGAMYSYTGGGASPMHTRPGNVLVLLDIHTVEQLRVVLTSMLSSGHGTTRGTPVSVVSEMRLSPTSAMSTGRGLPLSRLRSRSLENAAIAQMPLSPLRASGSFVLEGDFASPTVVLLVARQLLHSPLLASVPPSLIVVKPILPRKLSVVIAAALGISVSAMFPPRNASPSQHSSVSGASEMSLASSLLGNPALGVLALNAGASESMQRLNRLARSTSSSLSLPRTLSKASALMNMPADARFVDSPDTDESERLWSPLHPSLRAAMAASSSSLLSSPEGSVSSIPMNFDHARITADLHVGMALPPVPPPVPSPHLPPPPRQLAPSASLPLTPTASLLSLRSTQGREGDTHRSLHILCVEDNPINQMVMVRLLRRLGHVVIIAPHGQAALDRFRANEPRFDLILMDVHMPEMDGYTATREIRATELNAVARQRVPIVAVTASTAEGERERCFSAGMDDFVSKPVGVAALISVIERWCPSSASS
jgi:CheY-like chemotaxis protein